MPLSIIAVRWKVDPLLGCGLPYLLMNLGAKLGALLHCELLYRGHRWLLDLIGRCWILPLVGAVRLHSLLLELLELLGLSTLLS